MRGDVWIVDEPTATGRRRASPRRESSRLGSTSGSGILSLGPPRAAGTSPSTSSVESPGAGTPTELAVGQVRRALAVLPSGLSASDRHLRLELRRHRPWPGDPDRGPHRGAARDRRPGSPAALADASTAEPTAYSGKGRPPIHGRPFRLPEIADQPLDDLPPEDAPDRAVWFKDPSHGLVTIAEWRDLHPYGAVGGKGLDCLSLSVIRVRSSACQSRRSGRSPSGSAGSAPSPCPI